VNHKPCKCGGLDFVLLEKIGGGLYSIQCRECGRSGPAKGNASAASAAWDADHEAVAKARDALESLAADCETEAKGSGHAMLLFAVADRIRTALALLGEEDHGTQ